MPNVPAYLRELHQSLDGRLRPEDVLAIIARGRPSALPEMCGQFRGARVPYGWSSMSTDFARPVGGARQLTSAERAFEGSIPDRSNINPDDPHDLRYVATMLAGQLGGSGPRLDRAERAQAGVELSRRKYNRRWRAMRRLHHKSNKLDVEIQKRVMQIIGHSGFASLIPLDTFVADPPAAHFIAYWTARKNLRRQFSLEGKQNPMDEIAGWFLNVCEGRKTTNWAMIAMACPRPIVLAKLNDKEIGNLLARWFTVMHTCAGILKNAWPGDVDRFTMIVRQGHDSSTWNAIAQAYNAARASWLSCIAALGAERVLDAALPGKIMRLMAADVAYWHRSVGHSFEPNTHVWALLPYPWDVLDGREVCTRATVERACAAAGLDPQTSGWTAPRPDAAPAPFSLTPELVHGVTVASPEWALLLRRAGVFSGKKLSDDPGLIADVAHGIAEGVVTSDLPLKSV